MDRKDYKYIYNSLNKNGSDRNFNYPIYIRNKEVATQEWVSKTIEGGLEDLEGNYLTIAKAAEIYLSKVDAQNTYLTQVNAQNIYLSKNDREWIACICWYSFKCFRRICSRRCFFR